MVNASSTYSAPVAPSPPRPRRDDIQGLRAVASLLVASFHIWFGTVSGGVDLFFVVGGFLLATTLIGELERNGRIRLGAYLKRTVSRLFPMAGLVLIVVTITLLLSSPALSFRRNAGDVFAAATYWENWRLAADATDYVAAGHAKSAVQHFWAMSVQGQITLVLLAVFVIVGWIAHRRSVSPRRLLTTVMVTITAASFVLALVLLADNPASAYFNTWARVWEFGVGALSALVLIRWTPSWPGWVRGLVSAVGLALVLTAGLLPQTWSYPGPVAFWPVTGAVLILAGGAAGPRGGGSLLTWRPLVWLGGLSYGLYLWSWPILKAYVDLWPARAVAGISVLDGIALLAASIAASWLTTRLLAKFASRRPAAAPIAERKAAAAESDQPAEVDTAGPRHSAAVPRAARRRDPRLVTTITIPIIALVSLFGVTIGPQVHQRALEELQSQEAVQDTALLQAAIREALDDPYIPNGQLTFGMDAVGPEWTVDGCLTVTEENKATCRYGPDDAARTVWIVGDSQAVTWASGLRAGMGDDVALQLMGLSMCPFTMGMVLGNLGDYANLCEDHNRWVVEQAAIDRPDVVVVAYGAWWVDEGYDFDFEVGSELGKGSAGLVGELTALGAQVVWLDSMPPTRKFDECWTASTVQQVRDTCETTLDDKFRTRATALAAGMEQAGALVVPTLGWFCDEVRLRCPAVTAGIPVKADTGHPSLAYTLYLSDVIEKELLLPLNVGH